MNGGFSQLQRRCNFANYVGLSLENDILQERTGLTIFHAVSEPSPRWTHVVLFRIQSALFLFRQVSRRCFVPIAYRSSIDDSDFVSIKSFGFLDGGVEIRTCR